MASRNQNRPPRSPSSKDGVGGGIPFDKRRRIGAGAGRVGGTTNTDRRPFGSVNKRLDVQSSSDAGSTDGSECQTIDFTKEEVEALANERIKMKKFDHKGNLELVTELNNRLKVCIIWFQKRDEAHLDEQGKLRDSLESSEKTCTQREVEMKDQEEKSNAIISELRNANSSLQEKLRQEEAQKLDAIDSHRREKEARIAVE